MSRRTYKKNYNLQSNFEVKENLLRGKRSQISKGWFLSRVYPQQIVEEQVDRKFRLPLKHDKQQNEMENGIPLVVTYNPAFRNLATTLWKNFNILYSAAEVRTVFTPSFLVRSKVYPLERGWVLQNVVPKDATFALMFQE